MDEGELDHQVYRPGLFEGKTAFLAGATSGINLRIAQRLAGLGANTYVISRDEGRVAAAVATLGAAAAGRTADVRDADGVSEALVDCVARFGPIDILVSGAAGNFLAEAKDLSPKGFRTVVDIDLVGSFHVLRAGFEHLRKPGAAVLNISALQSFMPTWQQVHAGAAKAGIDMMMRTMALEWGQYGVRVNSIAPGPVAGTEGMARLSPDDETSAAITRAIPLGRWADTDDVADLAIFLCSDAARNITGTLMVSDGGYSLNGRVLHA